MDIEERPNPDELLHAVHQEARGSTKGCLKIFLGMAAGVGKTYAMLEDARKQMQYGNSVIVGVINTHGREETAALLKGLKILPEKIIYYKDTPFSELDIDTLIALKPQIALIDELAHSNVPGSRHNKRWQDVEEILENGIDVYTTLNVQHIESLKDFIESIAGIPIRETVPDSIIESAMSIEIVDLTPKELLQRLKEGKVYLGDKSEIAARHFFQEDRLTALREVILRYAAEKVDHDLHGMMSTVERTKRWTARERLLVAVGPKATSQKLIRTTRRLAFNLNAPWIALHVDDGSTLDEEEQSILSKNLTLARDLGAEVITTTDSDISNAIVRVARQKGVTQIIIGRKSKAFPFNFFFNQSILDQLASKCEDIDLHIIKTASTEKTLKKRWEGFSLSQTLYPYTVISVFIFLFTLFNFTYLAPLIGYRVIGFFFLLCILFLSLFFRKGPIFFASLFYALIWQFLFVPNSEELSDSSAEDQILLLLYLLTAIITGVLTDRSRKNQELLEKREESTEALYEIVKEIATSPSSKQILFSVRKKLGYLLEGRCEIIVKKINGGLSYEAAPKVAQDEKERAAASWVFNNDKEAGWSTSTLSGGKNLFLPLKGFNEIVGVLAYQPLIKRELKFEERNFLYTVGHQLASYLERTFTEERNHKLQYLNKTEKIYQSVLNVLSSQMQNPLQKTRDAINDLKNKEVFITNSEDLVSIQLIEEYSAELAHVIENISAMAQLSAGLTPINKTTHKIDELIEFCCDSLRKALKNYKLTVNIENNIPFAQFDFHLLQILLCNLIVNSIENSPEGSEIEIVTSLDNNNKIVIVVKDQGKGIPQDMLDSVFDKFYKIPGTKSSGLGLGLSIARTIAEIHEGSLTAENRIDKGTKFTFTLPLDG